MRSSQFINDFSKIAQGAATTINALKDELEILISQRLERFLAKKGLVTREEHDVALDRINRMQIQIDGLNALVKKEKPKRKSKT